MLVIWFFRNYLVELSVHLFNRESPIVTLFWRQIVAVYRDIFLRILSAKFPGKNLQSLGKNLLVAILGTHQIQDGFRKFKNYEAKHAMFVYCCYFIMEFEIFVATNNGLFIALLLIFWPSNCHRMLFLDWILILGKNLEKIYFWRFLAFWRGCATLSTAIGRCISVRKLYYVRS